MGFLSSSFPELFPPRPEALAPDTSSPPREFDSKDALSYMETVKMKFQERPDVYNQFLDILNDLKSQTIDTPSVIERVLTLFEGHRSLIQGFNTFLPQGYYIECFSKGDDSTNTINGNSHRSMSSESFFTIVQLPGVAQPNAYFPPGPPGAPQPSSSRYPHGPPPGPGAPLAPYNDPVPPGACTPMGPSLGLPQQLPRSVSSRPVHSPHPTSSGVATVLDELQHPNGPPVITGPLVAAPPPLQEHAPITAQDSKQPVESNHAINYANKIKNRLASDVDTYKQFLEFVQTYPTEQRPIQNEYKQAAVLFEDSTDLLDGFKEFPPYTMETALEGGMGTGGGLFGMIGRMTPGSPGVGHPSLPPPRNAGGSKDRRPPSSSSPTQSQVGHPLHGLDVTPAAAGKSKKRPAENDTPPPSPPIHTTHLQPHPSHIAAPDLAFRPRKAKKAKIKDDDTESPSSLQNSFSSAALNFSSQSTWPSPSSLPTTATMDILDDVGLAITWVSPNPVKINGHFCDVFEGKHAQAGKVALKRPRIGATGYDDVVVRRFEREAATWRNLRHPHVLEFLGTFKRDGHIYFVSPFINNGTLVEYILDHPNVNRIILLCEAADAVQYLHRVGVLHGDLKANNILIDDNGQSLLCDFGLTKTIDSRTSTAMRGAGTFRWQSPELWNDAPKSFESDVYAFGMTIAEVLTGEAPFADLTNDVAVMLAVMTRDERPSKIPTKSSNGISYESIWDVAAACWSKNPTDRISMFEALQRIRADPSLTDNYQS